MKPTRLHPHHEVPIFILAGGFGTRISEETQLKPKPMIEIGQVPILVHILRSYYAEGFNNFVICAGYRSSEIKEYFLNYRYLHQDLDFDSREEGFEKCEAISGETSMERWRVRVIDTGENVMTGARIARAFDKIALTDKFENFGVTYGDGLSDVSLTKEFKFHCQHGKTGTVLGVKNPARYGEIEVAGDSQATGFFEKSESRQGFVSGGFFFFKKELRTVLSTQPDLTLETLPLQTLANTGQLQVFKHDGFWKCMDTLRDKNQLEELLRNGKAPWIRRKKAVRIDTEKVKAASL